MASLLSRLEMYHFGVKVSVIEPGFFNTGITHAASVEKIFLKYWERLPDETKASYGDKYWKDYLANMNVANRSCNPNLSMVTDCMEHALTSRYPRCRYAVGWDARLFFIPLSYMPSAIFDAFFTHFYPKPAQRG
ncbi:17-beta-hydroxysteroid dehydrogenase type 6-like [Lagopus leucura]|uniref:17-beta-hydroxysteroid dehydrogenase type 6-like n=1 Tax=Lagopus leucura TaxID=30410 RepID=UPI001C675520|nr:17-beta-hydroxysteroid dehydrogenase type 6-like [Lagopus leucura]